MVQNSGRQLAVRDPGSDRERSKTGPPKIHKAALYRKQRSNGQVNLVNQKVSIYI